MSKLRWLLTVLAVVLAPTALLAQAGGTIRGTVVDASNQRPVAGAQVFVANTQIGTVTNVEGEFTLSNVPAGARSVRVTHPSYAAASRNVTVAAGQALNLTVQVTSSAVQLEGLVVTGVAGPTDKRNLPIVVSQIDSSALQVTASSAGSAIAGKVAGARVVAPTGLPGSAPDIILRAPKSINASGRGQDPLYIVDGVILGGSLADINADDIESVEVVKGAAASSLYGSRAANGVVQIRTKRGRGLSEGSTRYTFRSEYGWNALPKKPEFAQYHAYQMNAAKTKFISKETGEEIDYFDLDHSLAEGPSARSFQLNPYPGQQFDNIDRFFDPGNTVQGYIGIEGNQGNTNYHASFTKNTQDGILYNTDGYDRNAFRLNLDQGLGKPLQLSTNVYYSTATQGDVTEGSGSVFYSLSLAPTFLDLTRKNEGTGQVDHFLDPRSNEDNPVYELTYRDITNERERFLGGANLKWTLTDWFNVEGNVSYDQLVASQTDYRPSPYFTVQAASYNSGSLLKDSGKTTAMNGSVTGTFNRSFGSTENTTQVRYLYEDQDYNYFSAYASGFLARGIQNLEATDKEGRVGDSSREQITSEGYFVTSNFNIDNRYILDGLVRRDGSSLFGANERWQTYYRGAAAWRVSEEPWFTVPAIDQLKLRYSYGTAGGRPRFSAQYETYDVIGGSVRGVTMGNPDLKPELAKEHEAGVDMTLFNRFDATLTYANSEVEDQILPVPVSPLTGFTREWMNAGTLSSNTWEASLDARLIERDNFRWSARMLYDRTRQEITKLNVLPYRYGVNLQNLESVFYAREGEALGTFYGEKFATSCSEVTIANCESLFKLNDDGYLVYVGEDNTWRSGVGADGKAGTADDLWGSSATFDGRSYGWGLPFVLRNEEGLPFHRLGRTTPDFNLSFSSNLDWRGFSFYGLLDGSFGYDVYNLTRQWAFRDRRSPVQDQVGKADEEMKTDMYYQTLYNVANISSEFVEDGSFVKLRELSVRYTLSPDRLRGMGVGLDRVTLGLVGRNLKTWTDYSGIDPETGFSGGTAGSAVINRFDAYRYPNFRTVTALVEIGL